MSKAKTSFTREDWIAAARKIFVESDIEEVKIDRIAKKLKVTRGSFYWHFQNLEDLQSALLQDWQERNMKEMDEVRERWREGSTRIHDVGAIWLEEDPDFPKFSMAVRIWARKAAMVANVVRSVDYAWIKLLEMPFRADGRSDIESTARARVIYFHRIGYWALPMLESIEDRCELSPYFYEIFTGRKPDEEFFAQHEELVRNLTNPRKRA